MDIDRLIKRTIEIQSIPAPTFYESKRALYLKNAFQDANLKNIELDSAGNLYGLIPGSSNRSIIVSAHLDTVFPEDTPLGSHRDGNRIFGPGIGDNSIALATLVELALDLSSEKLERDIWLVANVCEEGLGNIRGMKAVVNRFQDQPRAYLILEGMALGCIYHKGLRVKRYRITVETAGGHSWAHAGRPSSIHTLFKLGSEIIDTTLPVDRRTSLNVGVINGGTSINTIANQASLELDLRSEGDAQLDALDIAIKDICHDYHDDEVTVKITMIGERPGGSLPADDPLIEAACKALKSAGVHECRLDVGSTDANAPLSRGYPAICIGLTRGDGAHTPQEYIEISPIEKGYKALTNLILSL
ncbi:MAG: M20/M25/M40 family metallo-hydrolase [Anaerolineales bacterium]|nr:M20/M25/M40 family metallo-hydrolase [Anaerolineales bacterium]MCK5635120.1 M20/M25/M40 family metallo-hydrolase [Anaerolineales bacterium]